MKNGTESSFLPPSSVTSEQARLLAWDVGAKECVQCSAKDGGEDFAALKRTVLRNLVEVDTKRKWKQLTKMVNI